MPSTKAAPSTAPTGSSRVRLDPDTILEAVLTLTARPGVTSLNVRELGRELGCDPTAIYRHFRGKDDLLNAALDRLHTQVLSRITADPEDWRQRLLQLVNATLDLFAAHPAIGMEAINTTTDGPGERAAVEFVLDALTRAGLDEAEVVRFYAVLSQYAMSSAAGLARSVAHGRSDDSSWFESAGTSSPEDHPRLAALGPQLRSLTEREPVSFGLDLILDAVERAAN
ncbi:MAG: TetR/AcrR family transcriptional regulator [Galactobacter sp.]|uniref:TetR/AcrR family transcriptional regulator n=1 Tax=Galactobacter sp. TaxID=2676125 RepID=UPI0025C45FAE|nr:TetR/AcrR family transcriptional regulator [Galactobacter sp.]